MSDTRILYMAKLAYHNRSEDMRDFPCCALIDRNVPIVVTTSVIVNSYFEYIYHPSIGLKSVTEEVSNLTCEDVINYYKGIDFDIEKKKKSIIKKKRSKRTAPKPTNEEHKSKRTNPSTPSKSKRTKPTKSKRTK
jgi:hypothetical protein